MSKINAKWHVIGSISLLVITAILLSIEPSTFILDFTDDNKYIGTASKLDDNAKVKHEKAASWINLKEGGPIYTNSMVYTEKETAAEYTLVDKTKIQQSPSTLMKFQFKRGQQKARDDQMIEMTLVRGKMGVKAQKDNRIDKIKSGNTTVNFKPDDTELVITKMKEEDQTKVSVEQGEVEMETRKDKVVLKAGMDATSTDDDVIEVAEDRSPYRPQSSGMEGGKGSGSGDNTVNFKNFIKKLGRIFYIN